MGFSQITTTSGGVLIRGGQSPRLNKKNVIRSNLLEKNASLH